MLSRSGGFPAVEKGRARRGVQAGGGRLCSAPPLHVPAAAAAGLRQPRSSTPAHQPHPRSSAPPPLINPAPCSPPPQQATVSPRLLRWRCWRGAATGRPCGSPPRRPRCASRWAEAGGAALGRGGAALCCWVARGSGLPARAAALSCGDVRRVELRGALCLLLPAQALCLCLCPARMWREPRPPCPPGSCSNDVLHVLPVLPAGGGSHAVDARPAAGRRQPGGGGVSASASGRARAGRRGRQGAPHRVCMLPTNLLLSSVYLPYPTVFRLFGPLT